MSFKAMMNSQRLWRMSQSWVGRCLIVLVALAAMNGAIPSAGFAQDELRAGYRLGAGDRVRVTVFGHEDLSGEFIVGTNGTISFPLVGEIPAQNQSLRQLETAIMERLSPDYLRDPKVAAEVLDYRPFYIIGEVNAPGSYPYVSGMRIVNAVALAGGFTYRAREDDLYITRAEGSGEKEDANQSTVVLPGDVIEVPQRFF